MSGYISSFSYPGADALPSRRNVDHFFFIDVVELEATLKSRSSFSDATLVNSSSFLSASRYRTQGRSANNGLLDDLRKDFGEMPGPQNIKMKDYAVMNVAPSVIPTYLPGVRVFT